MLNLIKHDNTVKPVEGYDENKPFHNRQEYLVRCKEGWYHLCTWHEELFIGEGMQPISMSDVRWWALLPEDGGGE